MAARHVAAEQEHARMVTLQSQHQNGQSLRRKLIDEQERRDALMLAAKQQPRAPGRRPAPRRLASISLGRMPEQGPGTVMVGIDKEKRSFW